MCSLFFLKYTCIFAIDVDVSSCNGTMLWFTYVVTSRPSHTTAVLSLSPLAIRMSLGKFVSPQLWLPQTTIPRGSSTPLFDHGFAPMRFRGRVARRTQMAESPKRKRNTARNGRGESAIRGPHEQKGKEVESGAKRKHRGCSTGDLVLAQMAPSRHVLENPSSAPCGR